ncbi:uncharacterized protein [Haliotis asinina]|uniref:uncharacterized protein n=1 Tax=Haliotis asinina TaxID=109174 RepID=UPI003531CB14
MEEFSDRHSVDEDDIGDGSNEVSPPGDETDVLPAGDDVGNRNNEVAPPGEEENQGLHTSPPDQPTSIPVMVSEPAEEDTLQDLAPSHQQLPVTETNQLSLYMRSRVLEAGINVSDNVTVSTSEGQQAAPESQDSPEEDTEQLQGQQPLNLQSPHRGEISLHAEQSVYNQYHNMRLIMESGFGQSNPVGHVPPTAAQYLSETNFNMEEIVSIWERTDNLCRRDQLLNLFIENSLYRPNIVQRGGYLALLHMLNDITGETYGDGYALRDVGHGVLLNNQEYLEPSNGHFRLGHEYFSVDGNRQTLRCFVPSKDYYFIRKTYCVSEWCGEQMIVPFLCGCSSIVQPLGLTWSGREVQVFLPVIQGVSLTDVLSHRGCGLTEQEVIFLTYGMLQIVSSLQRSKCLHRNITPDNVIISRVDQCLYLVGNRGLCRLQNSLSTIPSNLSFFTAPELARGEEHPTADLYSAGCTMISALNKKIPFFDINGIQRTRRNYQFQIGQGLYPPTVALSAIPGLDDFLRDVLIAMVTSNVAEHSAEEILRHYFRNQGREPVWFNSFFEPSPPAVPDMRRAEVQHQEHLNIPSEEILLSASDQVEVTTEEEPIVGGKSDDGNFPHDSGRYTSLTNEFCSVMVLEDGMEVCTLSLPWSEHASTVYRVIQAKMKMPQRYFLRHNGQILRFEKQLNELPETHPTMPLRLHLHRLSEIGSRSNQRSGSRTVIEGAAYNGDDHVVYDDSVQACKQSFMTGESDEQFTPREDDEHPEEDKLQEEVCPGDIGDEAENQGSDNTNEENADDLEQGNELLGEGGEDLSDFRSTNMEGQMSLEGQEDALIDETGEDGGRNINDADSNASVCGDSLTCSEENSTEDEGDASNEEGEGVVGPSSRNEPRASVDPEDSDSETVDEVVRDVDSEVNGSESDENDEGGDSGLTGDATETSSFSDVGVTVTNEASTPMSEECGSLEDDS